MTTTTKNAVTISKSWVATVNEFQATDGYWSLNASGRGHAVANVAGPIEIETDEIGVDWAIIDGERHPLRNVLYFAERGERGLSIIA